MSYRFTFLLGAGASAASHGICMAAGLASVPIGLQYFGPIRYGTWMVITSVLSYLNFCQFGIPSATQTLTAQSADPTYQRAVLWRSVSLMTLGCLACLTLVLLVTRILPTWSAVLGMIPPPLVDEAAGATLVLGLLSLVRFPTAAFGAAFAGLQEVHWERFYASLSSLLELGSLLGCIAAKGDLVLLACLRGVGGLVVGIVSGIHLVAFHPYLRPSLVEAAAGRPLTHLIWRSGTRFLLISISAMLVWSTDNLVISNVLGPHMVTPYSVAFKLFFQGFAIIMAINGVLWPMYGRAAGTQQWLWVQRAYSVATSLLPVLGGFLWVAGSAFAEEIIVLWAGPENYAGPLVVASLGAYGYVLSHVNCHSALLSGMNATRNLLLVGVVEGSLNLALSLVLVRPLGMGGVALGTVLASLTTSFWMLPRDVARQTAGRVRLRVRPSALHAATVVVPSLIAIHLVQCWVLSEWLSVLARSVIVGLYLWVSWRTVSPQVRSFIWGELREVLSRLKLPQRQTRL